MGQKLSLMLTLVSALLVPIVPALAVSPNEGKACQLIQHEVDLYYAQGGSCPCPYQAASNGSLCGGRSAWARRQGASPRCFIGEDDGAPSSSVTVAAQHTRWPDPPACGMRTMSGNPIPPRTAETRTAALPSSE